MSEWRALRTSLWIAIGVALALIAFGIVVKSVPSTLEDDAFMHVRYADTILARGKIAWNPDGPPTFGLTSNLYLAVVLPIRFLLGGDPGLTAWLSSLISGGLFLALLGVLIWRHTPAGATTRLAATFAILFSMALAVEHFTAFFCKGMDTAFTMAYLTAYILAAKQHERTGSRASIAATGLLGGLAFWARPDLMLFTLAVPFALVLFARAPRARMRAAVVLALTVGIAGALVLFSFFYFDSALPLPFYVKGLRRYGPEIYRRYEQVAGIELRKYFLFYSLLPALVVLGIVAGIRRGARIPPVELSLFLAACSFIIYYRFFVLQIMYYDQRFYYPTLPALAFLAARGLAAVVERIPPPARQRLAAAPRYGFLLIPVIALAALFPKILATADEARASVGNGLFRFSIREEFARAGHFVWFALDRFSALPDDLTIATTEVGCPAAMSPGRAVIDIAGLHDTRFAHDGFSADILLREYRPDLIYLPLSAYPDMKEQILAHPLFAADYEYFPRRGLGTRMDVALRRDSRHFGAMRRIVQEKLGQVPGS